METATGLQIVFKPLASSLIHQMHAAFNSAFDDYPVSFHLTLEDFRRKFIDKLDIDFSTSIGAFHNSDLIGFLFTSLGRYGNKYTAYNGGTGVIPGFRGMKVAKRMVHSLVPVLKRKNLEQCVLEVLVNNDRAIHIYQDLGFLVNRELKCFKLDPVMFKLGKVNSIVLISNQSRPSWALYEKFADVRPSYLDSNEVIDRNLGNECILHAEIDNNLAGYVIFESQSGRISQIGVHPHYRRMGIGKALAKDVYHRSAKKTLTMINVPDESRTITHFLTAVGFENQFDQYEMILPL